MKGDGRRVMNLCTIVLPKTNARRMHKHKAAG